MIKTIAFTLFFKIYYLITFNAHDGRSNTTGIDNQTRTRVFVLFQVLAKDFLKSKAANRRFGTERFPFFVFLNI